MKNFDLISKFLTAKASEYRGASQSQSKGAKPVISRSWTENGPMLDRERTDKVCEKNSFGFLRYAAMVVLLMCLGVGQMWGETTTVTFTASEIVEGTAKSGVTVLKGATQATASKTFAGVTKTAVISVGKNASLIQTNKAATDTAFGFTVPVGDTITSITVHAASNSTTAGSSAVLFWAEAAPLGTTLQGASLLTLVSSSTTEEATTNQTVTVPAGARTVLFLKRATVNNSTTPTEVSGSNNYPSSSQTPNIRDVTITFAPKAASATPRTFKSGEKIYFKDASGNISNWGCLWKVSGGEVFAYFWNDTESAWSSSGISVDGNYNGANQIYEITVPGTSKEYTKVLFSRGPENTTPTFSPSSNQWAVTSDQTPDTGKNMYIQNTSDADGSGKYNGSWNKYAPGAALIGDFNDWDPDKGKFVDGRVILDLEASTDYEFKVLVGDGTVNTNYWSCSLCSKATNTVDPWQQLYSNQDNWSMTSGEAGEYCFHWDNTNQQLGIYYPQARLTKKTYLYFNGNANTAWNAKDPYHAKFSYKYYDTGGNHSDLFCANDTSPESHIYYTAVPNNDYIGRVQVMCMWTDHSAQHYYANTTYASGRTSTKQNCLVAPAAGDNGIDLTWGTYCPPTNKPTLTDNSTTQIAGTSGNGSKANPYLVATSGTIKVTAAATQKVNDGNMTKKFDFEVNKSSEQDDTGSTYDYSVPATNNVVYKMTVKAYNNYNSTDGTKTVSDTVYYKALTPYTVEHSLTNVTKSEGLTTTAYGLVYTATFAGATGYNLPTTVTVTIGGETATLTTDYTYNSSTGEVTILANKINGNVVISVSGVAKTTSITLDDNDENHGATGDGSAVATYDATSLTSVTHTTPAADYQLKGYYTAKTDGTKIINADGSFVTATTTYTTSDGKWKSELAELTLYAQYEEIDYCYEFAPTLTSGSLSQYDVAVTSSGGIMEYTPGGDGSPTLSYSKFGDNNGLLFGNASSCIVTIALENNIQEGTVITAEVIASSNKSDRTLYLRSASSGTNLDTWTIDASSGTANDVETFTYTVPAEGALIGTNTFRIVRKNNAAIKSLKVSNCGSAATTYNVSHTLSHVSFSSGIDAGTGAALAGGNYTAIFEADDCYTLPSTITVTIGGDTKTVNTDYKWDSSTGKLVIWGAKVTGAIGVTITGVDNHTDPELAYETTAVSKKDDDAAFTNTLTNDYGVTVSYESSDKDVATVDSDGEVTIVGTGTCTITASADAQDCYTADDASYTLTVTSCTTPTVSWSTTPANGIVGGSMTAAVTTNYSDGLAYSVTGATPSDCVTINSSGVISYVKPGTATVKATVTGDGSTYCEGPAEVSQAIIVHNAQVENGTYAYYYSDASHFDGTNTYKNPEGNTPGGSDGDNTALTSSWTIRNSSFMDGLTSIVATNACYDKKNNHINAYIKLRPDDSGKIVFTIADGYTATIKIKMGGYDATNTNLTMKLNDSGDNIAYSGTMAGKATTEDSFAELTYADLAAGAYTLKPTSGSLYISMIDIETTSLGYAITKSATNGTISTKVGGSEVSYAAEGATVTITATPSTGYHFTGWTVTDEDEGSVSVASASSNPTTFTMPGKAVTVSAGFEINNYRVTVKSGYKGAYTVKVGEGSPTTYSTYANYGQTITLRTTSKNDGYVWSTWGVTMTETGEDVSVAADSTFTMPDGPVTIRPIYGKLYTVSFNGNGGRSVSSPISQTTVGASITLPAKPTADSTFVGWVIGSETYAAGAEYTPTADVTAYAAWKAKCAGGDPGSTKIIGFTTATCESGATEGGERALSNVTNLTVAHEVVSTTSGALATYTTANQQLETTDKNTKVYSRGGYKWNVNTGTTLGTSNNTAGFSVTVASGYQFTLDSISFAIGATANMVYQIIVYQDGDTLYKSSEYTFTRNDKTSNPNHKFNVTGLSAQTKLQNLTGTFYVRARLAFNATSKYLFFPTFQVIGNLHEDSSGSCFYVTYEGNGAIGGITNDATAYAADAPVTVAANGFSHPGYTFTGWNTKADGSGTDKAAGSSLTITKDTTLYAQWSPVVLYFNKTGSGTDYDWFNVKNWTIENGDPGCVPTLEHDVVIQKQARLYGTEVSGDGNHAKAKSIKIDKTAVGHQNDRLEIWSYCSMIVADGITAKHQGEAGFGATTWADLKIETSILGNGGLVCGGASTNTEVTYIYRTKAFMVKVDGKKYYRNQYFGIPFTSINANQYLGSVLYIYDNDNDAWKAPEAVDGKVMLQPFTAYNLLRKVEAGDDFDLSGTLNLPGTGAGRQRVLECGWRNSSDPKWTIENPFPASIDNIDGHQDFMFANSWSAPIDIASLDSTEDCSDLVQTIYIFNTGYEVGGVKQIGDEDGQWSAFPFEASAYMENAIIPATQAFLVTAKAEGATLTLDYKKHVYDPAVRAGQTNTFPTRAPRRNRAEYDDPIKLKMTVQSDSLILDKLYMFERPDFTNTFDNGWDGTKIEGVTTVPMLYGIQGNSKMAVCALPELEGAEIGFRAGTKSDVYTFSFEYDETVEPLYLYDRETEEFTRIHDKTTYTFSTNDRAEHARFMLTRSKSPWIATGFIDAIPSSQEVDTSVRKLIKNDHVYILRGGHMYSVDGCLVK